MDGVIADLDTGINKYIKRKYNIDLLPEYHHDKRFYGYLKEFCDDIEEGFKNLPFLQNADKLLDFISKLECNKLILTSCGSFHPNRPLISNQKLSWFVKVFSKLKGIPFTTTTSGIDKSILAHPNIMLIDDLDRNVNAFIAQGGKGFIYSIDKYEECIEEIKKFIEGV